MKASDGVLSVWLGIVLFKSKLMFTFSVLLITCATQGASSSGLFLNSRVCPISVSLSLYLHFFPPEIPEQPMTTITSKSIPNLFLHCRFVDLVGGRLG